MNKTKIVGVVVVLIVIVGLIWAFTGSSKQEVSQLDAVDTAGDFYRQWLKAVQMPETADPDLKTLAKSPILSKTLRDKIKSAQKDSDEIDPVLCQTTTPEDISMRRVLIGEEEAQIVVTSKDKSVTNQAFITLNKLNDGWYINDISCSLGEFAPEREFSFEKEGYLLKSSIPSPYNANDWHLIFEENNIPGHVVPLFFDSESQCTDLDQNKSVCSPDQFTEAMKVFTRGQMSERGVSVKQLEIIK